MRFELVADPRAFAAAVEPFLHDDPERNLLATVLRAVVAAAERSAASGSARSGSAPSRSTPSGRRRPAVLARGVDERGGTAAVALRTPPRPMLCTRIADGDAGPLLDLWLRRDPEPPGAIAVTPTARALAAAWRARTGGETRCATRMATHALRAVSDPPRPPDGRARRASTADFDLLVKWWRDFTLEARTGELEDDHSAFVSARLAEGAVWLWETGSGEPVSLVSANPAVAGVVRIGPVYTPPSHRRHGYAGAAVAAVSREVLAAGAHTCALFTDLANPTSNKIYAEVGYRRTGEWEEHLFTPRPPPPSTAPGRTAAPASPDARP